jgi:TPR repeat protein
VPASAVESTLNDQYGAEELATAQKYLQAGPNNAALAIPWLWKAVAKENPNAPLILSDLYLRGDGVPKSCDQARVLLRAAARKGGWTAADRLRKLPDFGCQ